MLFLRGFSLTVLLFACVAWTDAVPSRLFKSEGHGRKVDGYFPDDDPRRITALNNVVTPHIVWAKPLAGGPVRVLCIAAKTDGRWPVELGQRFDFDVRTVYGHDQSQLGAPAGRGLFVQGQADVEARILQEMNGRVDVVVSGIVPGALGQNVTNRLRQLLKAGVGYVGPVEGLDLADWQKNETVPAAMLQVAAPLLGLRLFEREYGAVENAADTIFQVWEGPSGGKAVDLSKYPRDGQPPEPERLQYDWLPNMEQEAWCSLMGRAILWTAERVSADGGAEFAEAARVLDRPGLPSVLSIAGVNEARVAIRIWDADGRLRHEGRDGEIPKLPAGRYFLGLQRLSVEGLVEDWTLNTFEVTAPVHVVSVQLERTLIRPGEPVVAFVKLSTEPPSDYCVVFEVLDNLGRCVFRTEGPASLEARFEGNAEGSLHLYNYAQATLLDPEGSVVSQERAGFFLERPLPESDDLRTMVWEGCASFEPVQRAMLRRFTQLGADAVLQGPDEETAQAAAMSNLHMVPYVARMNSPRVNEDGVREPCITAPAYLDSIKKEIAELSRRLKAYSPLAYTLGDDQQYLAESQDACWSPSCHAMFAGWTRQKYGGIEEVNNAWGTRYGDFEEVTPVKKAEVLAAAQRGTSPDFGPLCHWVDHALFLDEMVAGWHRSLADVIEGIDPDTVAWYDCTVEGWARPGSGWDFWKMAEKSRLCVQYLNPMVHDIYCSAQKRGAYHGTWYGGYGLFNYAPFYDAEFHPWWSVFRGLNLHGLYYGGNSPNYSEERLICPDLGCTQHFEKIMDNIRELQGGIAKLLFNAKRLHDGIAVVYSPASVHLTLLLGDGLPGASEWEGQSTDSPAFVYMHCWEALTLLLRDLGFSYDVIPSSALEDGAVLERDYRLLVMPLNLRVTEKEAETVRRFVKGGGTLLTDAFLGAFTDPVRPSDGGVLKDVLGLQFDRGIPGGGVSFQDAARNDGPSLGSWAVDSSVRVETAQPAAKAKDGTPAFLINPYGNGSAIYLNLLARDYQIARTTAAEMPFRDAVGALLAERGGLTPAVACEVDVRGKDVPAHRILASEMHRYELDGGYYVGLLRHAKLRPDDSIYLADLRPKPVHITFDRTAHVYDVRRGMYRGFTNAIEDVFYPARAELYALLPYEVREIEVRAEATESAVMVTGRIVAGPADVKAACHVLHVEVTDPAGKEHPEYARNVLAPEGHFSVRIFFGYNVCEGAWTLRLRDVASGVVKACRVDMSQ